MDQVPHFFLVGSVGLQKYRCSLHVAVIEITAQCVPEHFGLI
jgi:hypothetical protein